MEFNITRRLQRAFNAFANRDPTRGYQSNGPGYSARPDRPRLSGGNERSIITAIFNRISLDVASIGFRHCKLDKDGRYIEDVDSELNNCLTLEANIDQTARSYIQDVTMSAMDEGGVAMVPVYTTADPMLTDSYDILSMRTGKILEWYPEKVLVQVYNERTGEKEDILLSKRQIGIVENPLYSIINEQNSTFKRLSRKLSLLDVTDERTASGKLDLLIQLPYAIKSEARRNQAETRRTDIEKQLTGSKYGIAYIDSTEKVVQLNRSLENNLMKQIEYLQDLLYSQLGITQEVLNGTADEKTMLNYMNEYEKCSPAAAPTQGLCRGCALCKARSKSPPALPYPPGRAPVPHPWQRVLCQGSVRPRASRLQRAAAEPCRVQGRIRSAFQLCTTRQAVGIRFRLK